MGEFDQKGWVKKRARLAQTTPADTGQGELFGDDCSQPDAADSEPVFRTAGGRQVVAIDAGVQPDAAKSL
jgi:hypothetical protein